MAGEVGNVARDQSKCSIEEKTQQSVLGPAAQANQLPPIGFYKLRGKAVQAVINNENFQRDAETWKHSRRSSAIILGTDFNADPQDAAAAAIGNGTVMNRSSTSGLVSSNSQTTLITTSSASSHQPLHTQCGRLLDSNQSYVGKYHKNSHAHSNQHHLSKSSGGQFNSSLNKFRLSSDDLLMMATRNNQNQLIIANGSKNQIYENLKQHQPNINSFPKLTSSFTNNKRNRKLTKDSGYESAGTLINGSNSEVNCPVFGVPQQQGALPPVVPSLSIHNHSRSQSIDSTDSSNCLRSLSPRFLLKNDSSRINHSSDDLESGSPPPPQPPVRFSSLPKHQEQKLVTSNSYRPSNENERANVSTVSYSRSHSHSLLDSSTILQANHQQSAYLHVKQDSCPGFASSQMNLTQPAPVSADVSHTCLPQSASLSSLTNSNYQMSQNRLLPLVIPNGNSQCSHGSLEMLLDKENVENFPPQPLSQSSSPPPPLPPKKVNSKSSCKSVISKRNQAPYSNDSLKSMNGKQIASNPTKNNQIINTEIKEIQKRALYEFYLRQKEKKEKEAAASNSDTSFKTVQHTSNVHENSVPIVDNDSTSYDQVRHHHLANTVSKVSF